MNINWSEKNMIELELFFSTDIKKGLTHEQYLKSKEQYGENIIDSDLLEQQNFYGLKKKKRNIKAMLSGSAGIAGVLYFFTVILLKIIRFEISNIYLLLSFYIFMAVFTFILCANTEKKYERLYKAARPKALVIREDKRKKVYIENIVPGDLILISAGDIVPADARIVSDAYLSCIHINENGNPVKITNSNVVYAADVVETGSASAIVISTGKDTRIAINAEENDNLLNLSNLSNSRENPNMRGESSTMQKYIRRLSRNLFLTSIFLSMLLIFAGIMQNRDFMTLIMTCLTVLVASFSEQLPIIADFAVLNGMTALSKLGILIKKPSVIDEINDMDTFIAKKNESFTRDNKMTLVKISDKKVAIENAAQIGYILNCMAMCSNVDISYTGQNQNMPVYTGSAIDVAVFEALNKCGLNYDGINQSNQKIGKTIYNPKNGIKSAIVLERGGKAQSKLICFGEAVNILERCIKANGNILDSKYLNLYMNKIEDLYKESDLIMAVASKSFSHKEVAGKADKDKEMESGLEFLGFASFSEPKKIDKNQTLSVCESIACLQNGGINPVMIADSDTVYSRSAAVKFGIVKNQSEENILTDYKINKIGDNIFFANADKFRLFAPISLENRLKFLKALKTKKKSPAITINDIEEKSLLSEPCLTFTSVNTETGILKNKAAVITKNLAVSTILETVKNSVLIYKNILTIARFSSTLFISQYLLIFFASLLNGAYILNPLHIIWAGAGAGFILTAFLCFNGWNERNYDWQSFRKKIREYNEPKKLNGDVLKHGLIYGSFIFAAVIISFLGCVSVKEFEYPSIRGGGENFIGIFKLYINSHSSHKMIEIIKSAQTAAFITYITSCTAFAYSNLKCSRFGILSQNIIIAVNSVLVLCAVFIPVVRDLVGFGKIDIPVFVFSVLYGILACIIARLVEKNIFKQG